MTNTIAIFGATSQIFLSVLHCFIEKEGIGLELFVRDVASIDQDLKRILAENRVKIQDYNAFRDAVYYTAIINFTGCGGIKTTGKIMPQELDSLEYIDALALNYLNCNPDCKYIYLSSGAVFGSVFDLPAERSRPAEIPVSMLAERDWYGAVKLVSELKHRMRPDLNIIDLRIFGYFSHGFDLHSGFLVTDIASAIKGSRTLVVSTENFVRDYMVPYDFYQLLLCILKTSIPINTPIDCYSRSPIEKFELLEALREEFHLSYEIAQERRESRLGGVKNAYYSLDRTASRFGYTPHYTSLDGLISELSKLR